MLVWIEPPLSRRNNWEQQAGRCGFLGKGDFIRGERHGCAVLRTKGHKRT